MDQLRGDAEAIPNPANAPLQNIGYTKCCSDLAYILALTLESECRGARNDLESGDLSEGIDNFSCEPV